MHTYESYLGKKPITINVLGDPKVGKSSLLYSLFNQDYNPNIKFNNNNIWSNSYTFCFGNIKFELKFEETNGTIITFNEIQKYDALIFLYSLTDKNSFLNLNYFLDLYKSEYFQGRDVPVIIAGTKLDAPNQIIPCLKEIKSLKIPYYDINSSDIDSIHNLLHMLLQPLAKREELIIKKNERILRNIDKSQRALSKKKYLTSPTASLVNIFSKITNGSKKIEKEKPLNF
ncbi:hypothetical protein DICPUDRAFT_84927 [Dictyostelium purpureum]|uniref:Small GTPase n=1 Tax=Dictyostelium purpureum TaxID=5786 RepID=F1A457_DICPU|nr:uncharacterized protein DICPUDRAFT_84927 [Dictyostelium purpureum]EGC29023.1 hypothetical protein DICPUDRAFT_84927 [Dictyostelium purpureum]|eukprot:XP_003294451.1 hypothetical protein DICPUDRAFT_84927 [Dictyostelium purpureum]